MTTNCVRCGYRLQPGQTQCPCGQVVGAPTGEFHARSENKEEDVPTGEFYTRLENKVEESSKNNLWKGLLIGIGFLFLFLLMENIMDTVFNAGAVSEGYVLIAAAAIIAVSLVQLVRKFLL